MLTRYLAFVVKASVVLYSIFILYFVISYGIPEVEKKLSPDILSLVQKIAQALTSSGNQTQTVKALHSAVDQIVTPGGAPGLVAK